MKWIGLIILLAAVMPLSGWLRRNPRHVPTAWMLTGFLPFVLVNLHLNVAPISWPDWSGHVKGVEFSVLDALAIALYFSLPRMRHPLPFKLSMLLYFSATVLSVFQAQVPIAALFYVWQLGRMFLIFAVVYKGCCADERVPRAILMGVAAGLFVEAGVAIWERFALGLVQASGTMIHQNLLGLVSHFVIFPFFALLLARRQGWWPPAVLLAGIAVELLTTSRATIGLAGLGYAIVFAVSAMRQWTSRKGMILAVSVVAIALISPLALSSFQHRFGVGSEQIDWISDDGEYDERAAFIRAASMMLSDHPLGVGANHYTLAAIADGYNQNAGVVYTSYGATVHNIYWLIAAEAGYPGLIAFALMLLRPLSVAFVCAWRFRKDQRSDLMLGLGVSMLIVYLHSFYEWIFITFQAQYLFALNLGLVAGLAQQLGYWRRSYHNVRFEVGARASI